MLRHVISLINLDVKIFISPKAHSPLEGSFARANKPHPSLAIVISSPFLANWLPTFYIFHSFLFTSFDVLHNNSLRNQELENFSFLLT
jgi:hypothetical protein